MHTPSAPFGERGIGLSKRINQSLSAQLFCGVLLSALAAALVFFCTLAINNQILDHTVYNRPFTQTISDQQFEKLQDYVTEEQITIKNLYRINAWCSRGDKVYLTIYLDDVILYESPIFDKKKPTPPDPRYFDPDLENPDTEYALVLSDGVTVRAFLDYYARDHFYFMASAISALISFLVFSLCFIVMVHRKLSYVKQLKQELDILAGGDLSYPVTLKSSDELGDLAAGIEQMRRSILAHQNAEDQIRSANSQLVTAMSHDLRTPLTSLLAYLELMDRGKYENQQQLQHFIHRSLEQTLRIKAMADKLFEYFLVYASEWEQPETESANADELFQQFGSEYSFSLESSGFSVESDFGALNGNMQVNLELLRRAFDNLFSNLLKYADPNYPITLSFHRQDEQVQLTLCNHISPQRNSRESTNIGLNTCCRIIQYHGGSFSSTEENGIFQVNISLPLQDISTEL